MPDRHNPTSEIQAFKAAIREMAEAMSAALEAWSAVEGAGANIPDGGPSSTQIENRGLLVDGGPKLYPFHESFDDLIHGVWGWVAEIEEAPLEAWNIDPQVLKEMKKTPQQLRQSALVAAQEFKRRAGVASKKAALKVVAEYEQKKAYGLTNQGTDAPCGKCGLPIAPGDVVMYGQGGAETHQVCPSDTQGWKSRLNMPKKPQPQQQPGMISPDAGAGHIGSTKQAAPPYDARDDEDLPGEETGAAGDTNDPNYDARDNEDLPEPPAVGEVGRTEPAVDHGFTHTPTEPLTPPTAPAAIPSVPEAPVAEGETEEEHEDHGANPEMERRAELEAELSDPETIEAVMAFLKEEGEIDNPQVKVEEGVWGWSEASNFATVTIGNMEFMVAPTSDAADEFATAMVKQQLRDEPENFTPSWLEDYIDTDRLRDSLMSDVEEQIRESPDSYGWEPGTKEEEEWNDELERYDENGERDSDGEYDKHGVRLNTEMLVPPKEEDETAPSDEWVEEKAKEILKDPMDYLRDIYGEETFKRAIEIAGIDEDKAAEDAVAADGAGHFLSSYDGETHDLPNGGVYWRHN